MAPRVEFLGFSRTVCRIEVADSADAAFAAARHFFRHSLTAVAGARPAFDLRIGAYEDHVHAEDATGEPVIIRASSAPEFNFRARRRVVGDRVRYVNEHTVLDVPVRCTGHAEPMKLGITEASVVQLIDFVRDLILRHEETLGTVILHAAALDSEGGVIAIAGRKGAGKTTTLLRGVAEPELRYYSGDKLFCSIIGGRLQCLPWRDWPHVGVGTLRARPELAEHVRATSEPRLDALGDEEKVLIDPDALEGWIGADFAVKRRPLRMVLLPEVHPGRPTEVRSVRDLEERWAHLNTIVDRTAATSFFTWQSFYVPDYRRMFAQLSRMRPLLANVAFVSVTGGLEVPLGELVRATGVA